MPTEPFNSAVTTNLAVLGVVMQNYFPTFVPATRYSGKPSNALVEWSDKQVVGGDGKIVKTKIHPGSFASFSNDALSGWGIPGRFEGKEVKIRWSERDPTTNDFSHFRMAGRLSLYELVNPASDTVIANIAEEIMGGVREDFVLKSAAIRNAPKSGQIAIINGTKKNNDAKTMSQCSAYTNGSTSCRAFVDNGAVAALPRGTRVDIYNGAVLVLDNLEVADEFNSSDTSSSSSGSVSFKVTANTTLGGGNVDNITDNYVIYYAGSYGGGTYGKEAWMAAPANTSDSFMGGRNRTQADYNWLQTRQIRLGATAAPIAKQMFDQAGDLLADSTDTVDKSYAIVAQAKQITSLRSQIDAAALIAWPSDSGDTERVANMGSMKLCYQHPSVGTIYFTADQLMRPDVADLVRLGDWFTCSWNPYGVNHIPGPLGNGMFHPMQSAVPNTGLSMFVQAHFYGEMADYCLQPLRQVRINALSIPV